MKPLLRLPLITAACLIALSPSPSVAADHRWQFLGGCRAADWFGLPSGTNSQGMPTCWAINDGGITGLAAPTLTDNAYIQLSTATAETLVSFAQPQRASSSSGFASLLSMAGSTSFAAGLDMARGSLHVTTLTLGAVQVGVGTGTTRLGRIAQSGGELQVIGTATVLGGSWDLSAGTAYAGTLKLQSTAAASGFKQSGGTLTAGSLDLSSLAGYSASFVQTAGTAQINQLEVGSTNTSLGTPAASFVSLSGAGSLLNGTGSFIIGSAGSGALTVQGGARWNSAGGVVGAAVDGLVTVTGLGSLAAASGAITVGMPGGTGRIVLSEGGRLQGTSLSLNNAPPLFGGAMGAALDASGYDTSASFTGAVIVGDVGRGRLSLHDGAQLTSQSGDVGANALYRGNVDISRDASWVVNGSLALGSRGVSSVTVESAGLLQAQSLSMGSITGARGVLSVSGAGTRLRVSGETNIGGSGWAAVSFLSGATAELGTTQLGVGMSDGENSLDLHGASQLTVNGNLIVGLVSNGVLRADEGSRIQVNGDAKIAYAGPAMGRVLLSGASTSWNQTGVLSVGLVGTGNFTVNQGAKLVVGQNLNIGKSGGSGALLLDGVGSSVVGKSVSVGEQAEGSLLVNGGATAQFDGGLSIGSGTQGRGSLNLGGVGSSLTASGSFVLGSGGTGALYLGEGGQLQTGTAQIGTSTAGQGLAEVWGAGTRWMVNGDLRVGFVQAGKLSITDGALVEVSGTTRKEHLLGSLLLQNATLRSNAVALGQPGQLDWRSGTLHVTGPSGVALDGAQLPFVLQLEAGRTLQVDHDLQLGAGSALLLGPGGALQATSLTLDGGLVSALGAGAPALAMDQIGTLSGRGLVNAALHGGQGYNTWIRAAGGALTLGQLARSDAIAYQGVLDTQDQTVLLLDTDLAELGVSTLVRDGGRLASVNGATITAGEELRSYGNASVQGRFVNNGLVVAETGRISFVDAVSGAGDFMGDVRFEAGYSPGNSPASVHFHGGNLYFGSNSQLDLEVGPASDQLLDIGLLHFEGRLRLIFQPGFKLAPGQSLQLLQFANFEGSLDPARIEVQGYDAGQLDLQQLTQHGLLATQPLGNTPAVPEPSSWLMGLVGGLGMVLRLRRRRTVELQ